MLLPFAAIYFCLASIRIPPVLGPEHACHHDRILVCFENLNRLSLARDLLTLACLFAGVDSVVRTQLRDASGSHHTFLVCWIWQAQSDICLTVAMPVHNSTTGVLSYLHLPFGTLLYEKACFRNSCTLYIGDKRVESLLVIGKPCDRISVRTSVIAATDSATGELCFAFRRETTNYLPLRSVQTTSDFRSVPY